jgi:hypothetical protein
LNAFLRHMSVRIWIAVLSGGLILFALMPLWQRVMGMAWISPPVVLVMAGCFGLAGWGMNQWGAALIRRQIAEAAVWERAGMISQAEAAFERARSTYDSFWLSPLLRRRMADGITRRLARFHLAQPVLSRNGQAMVGAYIHLHPEDEEVARSWLEETLRRDGHTREDHMLAERIGAALSDRVPIQRLLMQFYLLDGRSDFQAMQTYRRVWENHEELPDDLIRPLVRLLFNESYLNDWALRVYLKGYALGDAYCLEGIAAGLEHLRPNADNRKDLEMAGKIVSALDEPHRRKLMHNIKPARRAPAPVEKQSVLTDSVQWDEPDGESDEAPAAGLMAAVREAVAGAFKRIPELPVIRRHIGSMLRSVRMPARAYRMAGLVAVIAMVGIVATVGWNMLGRRPVQPAAPEPVSEIVLPAPVIDPFTIQVAAYLKPEDAQRYVERLKQQQVDAFWTKAASSNRTWYQVKVSHFATKEEARQYGEVLKSKGLIDDFYVANYSP